MKTKLANSQRGGRPLVKKQRRMGKIQTKEIEKPGSNSDDEDEDDDGEDDDDEDGDEDEDDDDSIADSE